MGKVTPTRKGVNVATFMQYPSGIAAAVVRMIASGVPAETLEFNPPSGFSSLSQANRGVFHPAGGAAIYLRAPADVMSSGREAAWVFSSDYELAGAGTQDNGQSAKGNDIIAFLTGVAPAVCRQINEDLGITASIDADGDGIPAASGSVFSPLPDAGDREMTSGRKGMRADVARIGETFTAQPFGCFDTDDNDPAAKLVYYHLLHKR